MCLPFSIVRIGTCISLVDGEHMGSQQHVTQLLRTSVYRFSFLQPAGTLPSLCIHFLVLFIEWEAESAAATE